MSNRRAMSDNPARRVIRISRRSQSASNSSRVIKTGRGASGAWTRTLSGPALPTSRNPPSLRHAMAGSGVLASRDQPVRWTRALSPNSLAHRSISGAPIVLVPSRCAICPASAATPWSCNSVTRAARPGSFDPAASVSMLTCSLQGGVASGVRRGQHRVLVRRRTADGQCSNPSPVGTKLDAMNWLSRAAPGAGGPPPAATLLTRDWITMLLPGPPSSTS